MVVYTCPLQGGAKQGSADSKWERALRGCAARLRWWLAALVTQSLGGTMDSTHSWLGLLDPVASGVWAGSGRLRGHLELSTCALARGNCRAGRGSHTPFSQTGASLPDTRTVSAVFQEKADAIVESADRGCCHPGSSTGRACCLQGPAGPAQEPQTWPGSHYPPRTIVPDWRLTLPLWLSSSSPPSGLNITLCPNPASLQFHKCQTGSSLGVGCSVRKPGFEFWNHTDWLCGLGQVP